jgi:protein transport protein SEC31
MISQQPQQKRIVEDVDRRVNVLFDALNSGSLSRSVVDELGALVQSELNLRLPV